MLSVSEIWRQVSCSGGRTNVSLRSDKLHALSVVLTFHPCGQKPSREMQTKLMFLLFAEDKEPDHRLLQDSSKELRAHMFLLVQQASSAEIADQDGAF